jgi:ABC-type nitrate/sulfonate/bicarbonate transport system substrate-binding protein
LDQQNKAYDWINANPTEAVEIASRILQVSMEDGMKLYQWSGLTKVMEAEDVTSLEADVDFLYQQNMIEQKINSRTFILPAAFNK